jgi:hypothetical protein
MPPVLRPLAFLALPLAVLAAEEVRYNRDIRPILSENCFSCHGPDEKARKAKLRLDLPAEALKEHKTGVPIVPGDLKKSEVWTRITSDDADDVMPPPKSHLQLTAADKAKVKAWLEQGAKYEDHWAFLPPRRPALPADLSGSPIDAFVDQGLRHAGLAANPEADRATLLRRLSLDLTGLAPSAEELQAFLQDRSPAAYEKQVDRLLASPHFGERMALDWLDAARYADTNGFSIDGGRHLWLWRDWVIQAFNDNKPYDRFLVEQLAGDLLPNATDGQLIATGFQRNNMNTHEGGTIPAENLLNYNADRVKTLGESVLGLTLACAQCHDHKFDPISQQDYYRIYAYFNTLGDAGLDGNGGNNSGPAVAKKTVLRTDEEGRLQARIAALRQTLATRDDAVLAAWLKEQKVWLADRAKGTRLHPINLTKISTPNSGGGFTVEGNTFKGLGGAAYDLLGELPKTAEPIIALRLVFQPKMTPGGKPAPKKGAAKDAKVAAEPPAAPAPVAYQVSAVDVTVDKVPGDQVNIHKLQKFSRVTASSVDATHPPGNVRAMNVRLAWQPDMKAGGDQSLTLTFAKPINAAETPSITTQVYFGTGRPPLQGQLFAVTGHDDGTDLPQDIITLVQTPEARRTPEQAAQLWAYVAGTGEALRRTRVDLANAEERLATLTQPQSTMVMNIAAKPRETFILNRGDYSQPTTKVEPGTPSALPPLPAGAPANRLGLAQWAVMKENPLTARVAVNRLWKTLFGTGLVPSAADFGLQGQWPSHPELLDWLAVEFVESGWDFKRLTRAIVTSATYKRSSVATAELLAQDPANRWLARGARFRLPAELIRDNALRASGLLVPQLGGPSVNPYSPFDLWREVSHYGSTPATAQNFVQDHGEKLYRRSLYTYWKRTAPPANMVAFDAPNREVCTVTRGNTTTPLQALVTLNDVQFAEAARVLAARILGQPGDDEARLRWAFREVVSREPGERELAVARRTLARERQRYVADPARATAALQVGEAPAAALPAPEQAAWMQVGVLLLNLSETVTHH